MSADLNGDGKIDFEEFMKHYADFLNMIEFNSHLSEQYNNVIQAEALKQKEELGEPEVWTVQLQHNNHSVHEFICTSKYQNTLKIAHQMGPNVYRNTLKPLLTGINFGIEKQLE